MQYEIERHADLPFFDWLSALTPEKSGTAQVFNKSLVCGYAAFDALESWMEDREYLIPDLPDVPSTIVYFMTSQAKRVFAALLYGHKQRALLAEVTLLQLAILPAGVRTVSGKQFQIPVHSVIYAPDDNVPISRQFVGQPANGAYMAIHETEPPSAVGTISTPNVRNWLRLDIGHPLMAAAHINTHAALLSLAQSSTGGGR